MSNAQKFLNAIKTVQNNQNNRNMGLDVMYGEVISSSPLQIKIDNRFILEEDFLILTTNVKEKRIDLSHNHTYTGGNTENALATEITVIPALSESEKVILLRINNGQQYVVLDRL